MLEFQRCIGSKFFFYGVQLHSFILDNHLFEVQREDFGDTSRLIDVVLVSTLEHMLKREIVAIVTVIKYEPLWYESYGTVGYKLMDDEDGHVWLEFGTRLVNGKTKFYFTHNVKSVRKKVSNGNQFIDPFDQWFEPRDC